jgi:hypothetical protein
LGFLKISRQIEDRALKGASLPLEPARLGGLLEPLLGMGEGFAL